MNHTLKTILVSSIDMGERARKEYSKIQELASSIQKHGLIQPIAVMDKEDGEYLLLAGGRRLTAHKELGLEKIDAKIYSKLDEYDRLCVEEAENHDREDLTYAEQVALALRIDNIQKLKFGVASTITRTAEILDKDRTTVSKDLKLAKAILENPELAKCKDKTEALKKVKKLEEDAIKEELTKRFERKLSEGTVDKARAVISNNFITGDFFEKAKSLQSGSFHLIEADPPYGIALKNIKQTSKETLEGYNEIDGKAYPTFLKNLIKECYRLLKKDGWLIFWFACEPWYHTIYTLLKETGFKVSAPALWIKPNGQTNQPDLFLASTFEPFFYARKGDALIYKPGTSNTFKVGMVHPDKKIHPTERPIELLEEILPCFCPPNGNICVPFLGSGNTLLAAANCSMNAVGWELTEEYKKKFLLNVLRSTPGNYKSLT